MGSFEKLGILVIVVIIVMILAVAIYQWGGTEVSPAGAGGGSELRIFPPVDDGGANRKSAGDGVREVDFLDKAEAQHGGKAALADATRNSWAGGIPKFHRVRSGDVVWKLVVRKWRLKESFSNAITRANPDMNMKLLRPGDVIRIPDPSAYRVAPRRKQPARRADRSKLRVYEVQEGDSLGSIAQQHLGRASRFVEIVELNDGIKPRNLAPGQKIYLPRK